jgi:hypothetical protein
MKYWTATIKASANPPAPYGIGEIIDEVTAPGPHELLELIEDATEGMSWTQTDIAITDQAGDEVSWDFMQRHYAQ